MHFQDDYCFLQELNPSVSQLLNSKGRQNYIVLLINLDMHVAGVTNISLVRRSSSDHILASTIWHTDSTQCCAPSVQWLCTTQGSVCAIHRDNKKGKAVPISGLAGNSLLPFLLTAESTETECTALK